MPLLRAFPWETCLLKRIGEALPASLPNPALPCPCEGQHVSPCAACLILSRVFVPF